VSGGVLHHGTHEEDGPATREVLTSPRLHRGRSSARGTEAAAEGGEEVAAKLRLASAWEPKVPRGGPRTSFDVGERVGDSDPAEQRRPVLM
jgi:hypothetical protein